MAIELKRDIYEELLQWKKNNSGLVLEVEGARQVGKTYILDKFAREQYEQYIYKYDWKVRAGFPELLSCNLSLGGWSAA